MPPGQTGADQPPPNQLPAGQPPQGQLPPGQPTTGQLQPEQPPQGQLPPGQPPGQPPEGPLLAWSHYRHGDSPLTADGVFEWTMPGPLRDWSFTPVLDAGPDGESSIWFAGMLPGSSGERLAPDAHLMFGGADYDFEVYSGTTLLYRHGDMEGGANRLHIQDAVFVPLEGHDPDRHLMLRIHTNRSHVLEGKIGPVMYGSLAELQLHLIERDLINLLIAFVFFLVGFGALILYLMNRENRSMLFFALFSLSMSLSRVLFSLRSPVQFIDLFELRVYAREPLAGFTMYMFALYFAHVLKPAFERIIRYIGRALMAGGLIALALKLAAPGLWERYTGQIADFERFGFAALCALCLVLGLLALRGRVNAEGKWFIAGLTCYLLVNMIGHPLRVYIEHNIGRVGWQPLEFVPVLIMLLEYSLLVCTVFFGIIAFRGFADVYRKIRAYNEQLESWNQTLEATVRERTRAIRNLLDHAGQGFLSIDERLVVQKEYSQECVRLFGKEIAGERYVELVAPHQADEQELQAEILRSVFAGDELHREVCLSLLPTEAEVEGYRVSLQYKWIPDHETASGKVMVILTDISEQRRLEDQMARERQVLRMVVHVIRHYRDFKDMLEEYRHFARHGLEAIVKAPLSVREKCEELARVAHTFKGNFAQLDFANMTRRLHEFETQLEGWKTKSAAPTPDARDEEADAGFADWCGRQNLLAWLEDDLRLLRDILGDQFDIDQDVVTVKIDRLRRIEQLVHTMLPGPEAKAIAEELRKLQHRPFRELLAMYPEYAARLAETSGKEIHPVRIAGGEQLVDPKIYTPFARTLIHVFRNMVDHGIEPPEERIAMGKERRGAIRCEISGDDKELRLTLSNNGRKADPAAISRTALAKELVTPAELESMTEAEQLMLVFRDGFTTKRTVSGVSGRGVGLAAVRKATEALGGTVRFESDEESTRFLFTIPLAGSPG